MAGRVVPMECAACGNRWDAGPKPDGSMLAGARCPRDRGGCGKVRKLPRAAIAAALAARTGGPLPATGVA